MITNWLAAVDNPKWTVAKTNHNPSWQHQPSENCNSITGKKTIRSRGRHSGYCHADSTVIERSWIVTVE